MSKILDDFEPVSIVSTPKRPTTRKSSNRSVMEPDYNTESNWELFKDRAKGTVADYAYGASWLFNKGQQLLTGENQDEDIANNGNAIDEFVGHKGYVPKKNDFSQIAVAGAGEGITDPLSYIPIGKGAYGVGTAIKNAAEGAVAGGAGAVGGEGGDAFGGIASAMVGGGLLGAGSTLARTGIVEGGKKVLPKGMFGKASDAIDQKAEKVIQDIVAAAMSADPTIKEKVIQASLAAARTGVNLPLSAVVGDNPVIMSEIRRLASEDAVFRGKYASQYEEAMKALQGSTERTFGTVANAQQQFNKMAVDNKTAESATKKKIEHKQVAFDKQIDAAAKAYAHAKDPEAVGATIAKLVDNQQEAAMARLSPQYEKLLTMADQSGLTLKAQDVEAINNFVKQYGDDNLFQRMPRVNNLLQKFFKPVEQNIDLLDANGMPIPHKAWEDKPIRELDSLKRAINKEIRDIGKSPARADQGPVLMELKRLVQGAIDNVDPDFAAAYKALDDRYKTEIGATFNTATINAMDRAKYNEDLIPKLTKNKSALSEFLVAGGAEGKQVAEDAFLLAFEKAAIKDGKLDDKAARKFLDNNRGALSLLPELKLQLTDSANVTSRLKASKERLDVQFRDAAKNKMLNFEGMDAQQLVNNLYNNSTYRGKFMSQYGKDKDSLNAARALMLDDIINHSNEPVTALFSDRTKAAAFNQMFGSTYAQRIQDLAVVSERLLKDPTKVHFSVTHGIAKDPLEKAIGVGAPEVISKLRDRFQSATYAISAILSKSATVKLEEARRAKVQEFLLDKESTTKFLNYIKQVEAGNKDAAMKAMKMIQKHGLDIASPMAKNAAKGAVVGAGAAHDIASDKQAQEETQQEYLDDFEPVGIVQ